MAAARASSGARAPGEEAASRVEALVERLDRDGDGGAQALDETLRLGCLGAHLAAERQGQADDDAVDLLVAREGGEACETVVRGHALDDGERACDGSVGSETATPVRASP